MSTTIDQRVVEMRFDNKNFESNVSTTMSTLDKLKQKLHLDGASKGLENISTAAKNVDMKGLSSSVETVGSKFSALEVMGVTALANITNSAVNAGKRIISALTIDPIKTGFNEYELKMDSVKTIMASTGESVETVNKYLDELNQYSDQTIYSFSDMTQNIGKFTNAGVKLEDAVLAIKGISNEAAVSGANANEASRAMYNFAQALSAGHVKLIDWKSIELANMATKEFKEQLIQSAVSCGTLTKTADGMYKTLDGTVLNSTKNFNESLQDQWMTTEVLVSTLKDYANEETEIGKKAFAAAQEVTKLSQMFDVLKETAQSGWAKTWELIFGNILEAKAVFTPLTNFFSGIIDSISDFRNSILESALASPFQALADKIESVTKVTEKAAKTAQDYADIVDRVINLEFGLGQERWDKLTEMGYDWAHVQNLVNEKLGDSYRYETDYKESVDDANKSQAVTIEQLAKMSEAQLEQIGFTKDEIDAFKELAEQSEKTGIPIQDLIKDMDKLSGRSLLINSFKNIGKGLIALFKALKTAWQDAFPPKSVEERANALYDFIAALHKFTTQLVPTKEELEDSNSTIGKLVRTFKGLFAIVDIITTIVGGGFKAAFTVVKTLLKYFNVDILTVTAKIGDLLVRFRDWVEEHNLLAKAVEWLAPHLEKFVKSIADFVKRIKDAGYIRKFANWIKEAAVSVGEWFNKIKNSKLIQGFIDRLIKSGNAIKNWVAGLKEADNIPKYILSGLVNGLKAGLGDVGKAIAEIGRILIDKIKTILGIHSPSTVFFAIGGFIMAGLLLGIQNGEGAIFDAIRNFGSKCINVLKEIDIGGLIAAAISAGIITGYIKISNAILNFSKMFQGLGQMFEGLGDMFEGIGKGVKNWLNSKAILNFAIAIGILAASVAVLSFIPAGKLWGAIGAIAVLSILLGGLMILMSQLGKVADGTGKGAKVTVELGKFALLFLSMSAALLLMALAMRTLGKMRTQDLVEGGVAVVVLVGVMVGFMAATRLLTKSVTKDVTGIDSNIQKISGMLIKMSIALLLIAAVVKILGGMDESSLKKGVFALTGIVAIIVGVMAATRLLSSNYSTLDVGNTLAKLGIALLLMAVTIKILGKMDTGAMIKGFVAISLFTLIIVGLMAATKLFTGNQTKADKIGSTIMGIGVAILLMAITAKILGDMDAGALAKGITAIAAFALIIVGLIAATKLASTKDLTKTATTLLLISIAIGILALVTTMISLLTPAALVKGIVAIAAFGGIIVGLMAATKLVGTNDLAKVGTTLILVAAAIAILAGVAALMGLIKLENLAKGILAVGLLTGLMVLLINSTKNAQACTGTIVALSVAVAVLALSVAALSYVDTAGLIVGTAAISILLVMFRVLLQAKSNIQSSLGTLIVMVVAIGVLAGALLLVSTIPTENAMTSVLAMSVLMLAMAALMKIIASMNIDEIRTKLAAGLLGLAAMGLIMWEFIAILKKMDGMEDAMSNVLAISTLMTVMTTLLLLTAAVGAIYMATFGVAATGLLGLAAMGALMLEFIGILKKMDGMEDAMSNVLAITTLMTAMSEVLLITAAVGTVYAATLGIAATGLLGLKALIPMISSFIEEISAVEAGSFTKEQLYTVLLAVEALKAIADASKDIPNSGGLLGALLGNNDLGTFAKQFPELGTGLRGFVDNIGEFTKTEIATIDCAATAVKKLSEASKNIDGQSGLGKWLTGDDSLAAFAKQFPALGEGLRSFIDKAGTFTDTDLETVKCATQVVKDLAKISGEIDGQSGFGKWLTGDDSLSTFSAQFPKLGEGLRGFINNIGTFTKAELETAKYAVDAVEKLAKASEGIPNSGGWAGAFAGENDLETFSTQFPKLGEGLRGFVDNIDTFTEAEGITVQCAADAVTKLATAANDIPNSGGWVGAIVGDNDLGVFAEQFPTLGSGLRGFVDNINTFTDAEVTTVGCASDAIVALAEASNNIDGQSNWAKKLFGDNSLSGLSAHLGNLGTGIKNFVTNLGTFTEAQVSTVKQAVSALEVIATLAATDLKATAKNIPNFGESLTDLATDFSTFCKNMPAYETVKSAIDAAKYAFTTMNGIGGSGSDAAATLSKSLKDLAKSGLDSFVDGFTNSSAKKAISNAGESLVENLIEGAEKKEDSLSKKAKSMAEDAADAAEKAKSDFKDAGKEVVTGFANGISLYTYIATRAARAMAEAAAEAAEDELDINSPSKVFMAIASSVPEGFAKGIDKFGGIVEQSSAAMGQTAIRGVNDSISRIAAVIDGDMDVQPTIRPVLDLSNVRSGAGLINGLLGTDSSIGVLANVGSISAMMNDRGQNGVNADVISAINKLRKDIGNINNTTYTINGVTYDDGSNISDAVKSIVRAAKVERRR